MTFYYWPMYILIQFHFIFKFHYMNVWKTYILIKDILFIFSIMNDVHQCNIFCTLFWLFWLLDIYAIFLFLFDIYHIIYLIILPLSITYNLTDQSNIYHLIQRYIYFKIKECTVYNIILFYKNVKNKLGIWFFYYSSR